MRTEKIDTLIFDFDGTLFDTEDGIIDSLRYSIERNGLKEKGRKELKAMIGVPLEDIYEKMVGKDKRIVARCVHDHRKKYREIIFKETRLFPHVRETLSTLKKRGLHIAVATTKPKVFAKRILKHYHMDKVFDTIIGSPMGKRELYKEKILDIAVKKIRFRNAAYVGDRKYDILAGRHHGLMTIGATYGIGGREELKKAGADHLIDDFSKILKIV